MNSKMEIDDVYLTNNSKVESISIISSPLCNHTQFKEIKSINNDTLNYIFCSTDDISKIIYDENTFNKDCNEKLDKSNVVEFYREISRKIFDIKKITKIEKRKDLLLRKRKKIGYSRKKRSKRPSNIKDMIVRNLIQEIIPNWINYNEKNKRNILKKIKPSILKDTYFFDKNKDKIIEDFYNLNITKTENNQNTIIEFIEKTDNDKLIKLKFTLMEAFTVFNDINSREEILLSKEPTLKKKNGEEKKAFIEKFYLGLKNKEEYIYEKGGNEKYQQKLEVKLNELSKLNFTEYLQ